MMPLSLILLALSVKALLANRSCIYDAVNPSPTDIGTGFCSSFITDHCAAVTSLDPEKVTSYCECLLTSATAPVSPVGNTTQAVETQAPATPTVTLSSASSVSGGTVSLVTSHSQTTPSGISSHLASSTVTNGNATIKTSVRATQTRMADASTITGRPGNATSLTTPATQSSSMLSSHTVQDGNSTTPVTPSSNISSQIRPTGPPIPTNGTSAAAGTSTSLTQDISTPGLSTPSTLQHSTYLTNSSSPTPLPSGTQTSVSSFTASAQTTPLSSTVSNSTYNTASEVNGQSTRANTPPGVSSVRVNATATQISTLLTTPSDAGVSGTQTPVTMPGNATMVTETPSPSSIFASRSRPVRSSRTWSGWNATSTGSPSARPIISGINATTAETPTTLATLSTSDFLSSTSGSISGTATTPTSRTDTRTVSGSTPSRTFSWSFISITSSITGSATTVEISQVTAFPTPLTRLSSLSWANWNSTTPRATPTTPASAFPAANFTSVTRTAAVAQETCYHLARDPQKGAPQRALMHNAKLREQNVSIPSLYIESVDFESDGIDPLWLTMRDSTESSHHLDISNKSQIAIVDRDGTSMKLDAHGIYFSTKDCRYEVSITISNLLGQLAELSGAECSAKMAKRLFDVRFKKTLVLRDQCDNPVGRSIRSYPRLSVGSSECTDVAVDEDTGTWKFDCTFPGSESGTLRCQAAIKNDIIDFLTTDPFGGACPDLPTVITTLSTTGKDFLSQESLRHELFAHDLSYGEELEAARDLDAYLQLWRVMQDIFAKDEAGRSALETYLKLYSTYRDFPTDVCEDIHANEIPLDLTLQAGVSRFVLYTLNFAPEDPAAQNVTVQDSSKKACCLPDLAHGSSESCGDPAGGLIGSSGCVCGKTVGGESIAFEYTECENFVATCKTDKDCGDHGHSGFVCVSDTCCGGGLCVDPYACSDSGTELVTYKPF